MLSHSAMRCAVVYSLIETEKPAKKQQEKRLETLMNKVEAARGGRPPLDQTWGTRVNAHITTWITKGWRSDSSLRMCPDQNCPSWPCFHHSCPVSISDSGTRIVSDFQNFWLKCTQLFSPMTHSSVWVKQDPHRMLLHNISASLTWLWYLSC